MSFRGIWIVAKDSQDKGHLLFCRKYPTVERRFCLIHGITDDYALPEDNWIVECVFNKLRIGRKTKSFNEKFDGCQQTMSAPVLELDVNGETLWPVVAIQKFNLVFLCLCLAERKDFNSTTPLIEIPVVSVAYTLLHNMAEFLKIDPAGDGNSQVASQVEELGLLLKILMPFGTPTETNVSTMKSLLIGKDLGGPTKYRLSAWRPVGGTKGKNQLQLNVQEHVSAAIYGQAGKTMFRDMCSVYGTVSCKADIEGIPEVALNFTSKPNISVVFHPCLHNNDVTSANEQNTLARRISFTPPNEVFPLCHVNGEPRLPVMGVYTFKVEKKVLELSVELQLNEELKNSFEYFEVHIPLFNCGPIIKWHFSKSSGTVLVSPERKKIVWSLGQKFPKRLLTTLTARVTLSNAASYETVEMKENPFCRGVNCYIQLFFKLLGSSASGIHVDPRSVNINPGVTPKVFVAQELISQDYKIWNNRGDALVAFPPTL